jgi:hypothetical protein
MMEDKRKDQRFQCFARVLFPSFAKYGHITDISHEGVKIRVPGKISDSLDGGVVLIIGIVDLGIVPFEVEAECKWSREEAKSTLLGFQVTSFKDPAGKALYERILEWYQEINPVEEIGPSLG